MTRGNLHSTLTALLASLALCTGGVASAQIGQEISLTTTYAAGNGQDGNMFDVDVLRSVILNRIDVHFPVGSVELEVYFREGVFSGVAATPGAWNLIGQTSFPCLGTGTPTPVPLLFDLLLQKDRTYSFYVTNRGLGNPSIHYTNGAGGSGSTPVYVSNAELAIHEGIGLSYPFGGTYSPRVWNGTLYYVLAEQPTLTAAPETLSIVSGGTQTLTITPGPDYSQRFFLLLGSLSGTSPGLPFGNLTIPLNVDNYTLFTLTSPNVSPLSNSLGILDSLGTATAFFNMPAGQPVSLIGTTFHHAYVVIDPNSVAEPFPLASTAAPLIVVP